MAGPPRLKLCCVTPRVLHKDETPQAPPQSNLTDLILWEVREPRVSDGDYP